MSTREQLAPGRLVHSRDDLVAFLADGEKPAAQFRIGTEHEKFVVRKEGLAPIGYDGDDGINALMLGLMDCCGWEPIRENGNIIALKRALGEPGANVSLEPGGQFELSGALLKTVHETALEVDEHLRQCHYAGSALGLGFFGMGFSPKWRLEQTPHMPKQRYDVMTRYMPSVGGRGLDMMYRTATIQVNLDFGSEADMVRKMHVGLALQPVATALFASSPFTDGRANGFKSMRSEVWRDTDAQRTGMLPFVFEDGMGYEAYVDYALGVPMYFVYREGKYIDVAGASFRDFLDGRLPGFEGERPTVDDWSDHLTTLFPEVRLKKFIEMRGADGGSYEMICAVPAFWTGLLYDTAALDAAWDLVKDWTQEEVQNLRDEVPRHALATPFRNLTVRDIARRVLEMSKAGLRNRDYRDTGDMDETRYLEPLEAIVDRGETVADRLLSQYNGPWSGNIDAVFEATSL